MNQRPARSIWIYLALIAVLIAGYYYVSTQTARNLTYSYEQFEKALDDNTVSAVNIKQNSEVPTGQIVVTLTDGSTGQFSVTDVRDIQKELQNYSNVAVTVSDVPQQSILLTVLLPVVLMAVMPGRTMSFTTDGGSTARCRSCITKPRPGWKNIS